MARKLACLLFDQPSTLMALGDQMYEVLAQMAGLIICGIFWRIKQPMGLAADDVRIRLTSVVYNLLLPALVLLVLWRAPLDLDVIKIAIVAAAGVIAGMLLARVVYGWMSVPGSVAGAMILASAFPNATYLGLPVLENTLGEWSRPVAIQYDLFACTPLLLTVGMMVGAAYGDGEKEKHPLLAVLKVPPLWAAIIALLLNISSVPLPNIIEGWLAMMAAAVIPLMLIALGMGLRWGNFTRSRIPIMVPVAVIQLILMPILVFWLAQVLELQGELLAAVVLEAAMPSMVLGLVICDRFKLDTALYASVVTLTTGLSMITLPIWLEILI